MLQCFENCLLSPVDLVAILVKMPNNENSLRNDCSFQLCDSKLQFFETKFNGQFSCVNEKLALTYI